MEFEDFWPSFSQGEDPDEVECEYDQNIAKNVLDTFGISNNLPSNGGTLNGLDLKRSDAMSAAKMSVLEMSADNGTIYELYTNGEGEVELIEIGNFDGLTDTEIYYQIQTGTFVEDCSGVMVTGKRPLAKRKKIEMLPIWQDGYKEVFETSWMTTSCLSKKFNAYATIVFDDPMLNSQWRDGIDNFYDLKSPWEHLLGYATYISWPNSDNSPDTKVTRSSQSKVPILVSGDPSTDTFNAKLGTLQKRPVVDADMRASEACFADSMNRVNFDDGVLIPIPDDFRYTNIRETQVDRLNGISGVYIIGRPIDEIMGIPNGDPEAIKDNPTTADAKAIASISAVENKIVKLSEGEHYQIAYDEPNGKAAIVFASNGRNNDPKDFGTDTVIEIDKNCDFYRKNNIEDTYTASILPVGGTKGYLVSQVFAIVEVNTPSITIYDPRVEEGASGHGMAYEIAKYLNYRLAPLISIEEPAPVAYAGRSFTGLIDMTEMQKDHDPREPQNFQDTDYERALDDMSNGGGMTLSLSFLDEGQALDLATSLYDYMNSSNGSIVTYVCSPDSDPKLGGYGLDSDSIINEISYSYQDSSSYTISVTCGPKLLGDFAQIDGGPSYKMTEEVSARATIIEDSGDSALFKVLIDGYGPMVGVNCTPTVLRVGDKVQVTVHNNPVEA